VLHVKTQMWSIVGSVEWRIGHRCSSAPEAMIKAVSDAPGNKHIRIEETRTSMRIANHDNRLVFLQRARTAVNWVSTSSMHLPCPGPTNTRRGR